MKTKRKPFIFEIARVLQLFFVFLFCFVAKFELTAQIAENTGVFRSISKNKNHYIIETEKSWLKITPYSDKILRIQVSRDNIFDEFSYSVVMSPECNTEDSLSDDEEAILLASGEITLKVHKNPFGLAFLNKKNELLNSDIPSSGIQFLNGSCYVYKQTFSGEKFIGLGEKTGPFNKAGRAYSNWNTDAPSYGIYEDPLYTSIPFYIGIHDSLIYGIYVDNTYKTDFSFGADSLNPGFFVCHGGEMDYFFISGESIADVVNSYTALTGRMQMPPMWSLGLHQSRWSYYPDSEVINIARTFREKKFPADAMTLDIHYMEDYKLFTWNKKLFPNPSKMISELKDLGFRTTAILDPGIKIEKGYQAYESGLNEDIFVKSSDGKTRYRAQVWPGWCNFPDFTNPKARNWWSENLKVLADDGVSGYWNDMNEPADWSKMFDPLARHDFEGNLSTHLGAHNVYGMQMARASYEGAVKHLNERPFVLSRAGFAGIQRYSAIWTGDNVSSDAHMLLGVRLINNIGLSGVPFCGMDIPGFSGGGLLDNELYARFVSIGAFSPFFRIHAARNTRAQEPWAFGEWVEETAKEYTEIRYQLLPYIYSCFYESTQNGMPVQRSLGFVNAFDPLIFDERYENQYYFGPSILVAPVISTQNFTKLYFPEEGYYDFFTDVFYPHKGEFIVESTNSKPKSKLPVFVKAGAIIPMQKIIQSTADNPGDTLMVHIYFGRDENSFVYYEDDGISFDYKNGSFFKRLITYNPSKYSIKFSKPEGIYNSKFSFIKLIFHGFTDFSEYVLLHDKKFKSAPIDKNYELIVPNLSEAFELLIKP